MIDEHTAEHSSENEGGSSRDKFNLGAPSANGGADLLSIGANAGCVYGPDGTRL